MFVFCVFVWERRSAEAAFVAKLPEIPSKRDSNSNVSLGGENPSLKWFEGKAEPSRALSRRKIHKTETNKRQSVISLFHFVDGFNSLML